MASNRDSSMSRADLLFEFDEELFAAHDAQHPNHPYFSCPVCTGTGGVGAGEVSEGQFDDAEEDSGASLDYTGFCRGLASRNPEERRTSTPVDRVPWVSRGRAVRVPVLRQIRGRASDPHPLVLVPAGFDDRLLRLYLRAHNLRPNSVLKVPEDRGYEDKV